MQETYTVSVNNKGWNGVFEIKTGENTFGTISKKGLFTYQAAINIGQEYVFRHVPFSRKYRVYSSSGKSAAQYTFKVKLATLGGSIDINGNRYTLNRKLDPNTWRRYIWQDDSGNEILNVNWGAKSHADYMSVMVNDSNERSTSYMLMLFSVYLIGYGYTSGSAK